MTQLFAHAVELMAIGMGIVFLFLTLLVVLVNAMTLVIHRFFAERTSPEPTLPAKPASEQDEEVIAAISAAVHRHRQRHAI